jgi:hypothetical protein
MKDFYYILGTASDASPPEIDAAYQKLASKFIQNDEQDEFMDAHFREICEAYDILRDTTRRRKYDLALRRNQKKQLAVFKLKYINIAVILTFLVVTGLFALYVIRTLRGHEAKKAILQPSATQQPVALAHSPKHHKTVAHVIYATKKLPVVPDPVASKPIPQKQLTPTPVIVRPQREIDDSTYITTLHANITGIVYLHESPDYNSAVIAKIPDAAPIRVLQKGPAYYKISYDDQTGYVLKSAVVKK